MSVRKQSLIATIAISGSRVAGLLREMVFAYFFGASQVLDAFITAFRIPNLLRDLFSEGALSQAFVVVFSKKRAAQDDAAAFRLAQLTQGFILVAVGLLVILGLIFSPQIISTVASGFSGEKQEYAIFLNRILFPFILFVSLAAVSMGMLNSFGKFALPQSASTFFNATSILFGLGFAYWLSPDYITGLFNQLFHHTQAQAQDWAATTRAMTGMALGTLLGGIIQWVIQLPALWQVGFKPSFKFNFKDSDLLHVLKLTGPAIIGGSAVQVNVLINTNFASYLADGSISWLNYAFRLMQFPIGVFGVAIASATAPQLARLFLGNRQSDIAQTLRNSLSMAFFLCLPSALGLILLADPIIALIYQRGHFSVVDTLQTAHALQAYAVGLVFYALIKIYQPAFVAFNDTKTPMYISLISIILNAVVNYVFIFVLHFQHWGLALGTSCVALGNFLWLAFLLRRKLPHLWTGSFVFNLFKIFVSSFLAIAAAYLAYQALAQNLLESNLANKLLLVFIPIFVTGLLYLLLAHIFRIAESQATLALIKRRFSR